MKERKVSPNWYIAATHFLTAGFIPRIIVAILAIPVVLLLKDFNLLITYIFIYFVVPITVFWTGVIYSSKYLNKAYIITDAKKIVNLSTLYFMSLVILPSLRSININAMIGIIGWSATILVFYLASKKYIKNNS